MKSKINNLENMKDGPSYVQLDSDVSSLKTGSFADLARGVESSVDKPADEALTATNIDDNDESDDEEEQAPKKKVTAATAKKESKKEAIAGA
jgi:hypothetical protein